MLHGIGKFLHLLLVQRESVSFFFCLIVVLVLKLPTQILLTRWQRMLLRAHPIPHTESASTVKLANSIILLWLCYLFKNQHRSLPTTGGPNLRGWRPMIYAMGSQNHQMSSRNLWALLKSKMAPQQRLLHHTLLHLNQISVNLHRLLIWLQKWDFRSSPSQSPFFAYDCPEN